MIDFLKYRWLTAILSAVMFATFIGALIYKHYTRGYTFIYSVEFTGGTQVLLKFQKPITGEEVVKLLENLGWQGAVARDFSSNEILIRVKEFSNDPAGLAENMRQDLSKALPDNPVVTEGNDSIGSGVGSAYWGKSIQAILIALVLMMIYIAWRFKSFSFAMGAFVSLFHDVIAVLTVYLLLDKEISLYVISAILTVLGYSINDTIVIFARIRENIKKLHNTSLYDIINISINETLRRTILTTLSTLLVVVALLLFGGETLRNLSLVLLIGMVFGIYSTIYIASPVMLLLHK